MNQVNNHVLNQFSKNCFDCDRDLKLILRNNNVVWQSCECGKTEESDASTATLNTVQKMEIEHKESLEKSHQEEEERVSGLNDRMRYEQIIIESGDVDAIIDLDIENTDELEFINRNPPNIYDEFKIDQEMLDGKFSLAEIDLKIILCGTLVSSRSELSKEEKKLLWKLEGYYKDKNYEPLIYDTLNVIIHHPKMIKDEESFLQRTDYLLSLLPSLDSNFLWLKWKISLNENPNIWKKDPIVPVGGLKVSYCKEYDGEIISNLRSSDPMLYVEIINGRLSIEEAWEKTPRLLRGCINCGEKPNFFLISHKCNNDDSYYLEINEREYKRTDLLDASFFQTTLDFTTRWACGNCCYANNSFFNRICNYCNFELSDNKFQELENFRIKCKEKLINEREKEDLFFKKYEGGKIDNFDNISLSVENINFTYEDKANDDFNKNFGPA